MSSVGKKNPVKNPSAHRVGKNRALVAGNPGNSGGKKGRSGRKPEVYRELCKALLESPEAQRSVARILKDDRHPHFGTIYKHVAEYAHGKPVQPLSGEDGGAVIVRVIREDATLASD